VLIVYVLALVVVGELLAMIMPPIAAQVQTLVQRLPTFARNVSRVAPETVQDWLAVYNAVVPEEIRVALQRSFQNVVESMVSTVQNGIFKTVSFVFSTVGFVLGLLVVPLWMFYVLRDQPEMAALLYRLVPAVYREDVRSVLTLVDDVLGAYLRGQLLLCISVAAMFTVGLAFLRIEFALLLGTIAGVFEIVPVLGPVLGAIPAALVTLATAPSKLVWVILLAFAVQQVENLFLVPQVTRGTVRLHPALVMIVLVVGSEIAGIWGVVLGVPLMATVRDLSRYLYLRLSDEPISPDEARARVQARGARALSLPRRRPPAKR
jgi:predicted PurR-regulated permease PerM